MGLLVACASGYRDTRTQADHEREGRAMAERWNKKHPERAPEPAWSVRSATSLPEIEVAVVDEGPGWQVTVRNSRSDTITIVWDESSFVATSGRSLGRLLRGRTRRGDSALPQPPSPVAPGATASEWSIAEEVADLPIVGAAGVPRETGDPPARLVLVIETSSGKVTWIGEVVLVLDASPDAAGPSSP